MHILIVRNNSNPQATDASLLLVAYLASQGIGHTLLDASELSIKNETKLKDDLAQKDIGLVVVLGGDGTILRSARLANASDTPILGINFGRLGFLANSSEDGVVAIVASALAGDVICERRANLRIQVACADDRDAGLEALLRDDDDDDDGSGGGGGAPLTGGHGKGEGEGEGSRRSFFALNEMALARGGDGRIIDFGLGISDASIAAMRGDGLVIATATGSTAYALSAGGPLVSPSFDGLVVVPLACHTLQSRGIITASHDVVEIDLANTPAAREASLFADGERLEFDSAPVKIWVRVGKRPTKLLCYNRRGFYEHAANTFF